MSGASDEDLLAAHLEGDRTAFAELVTRHERRVYGLCLRVLGNREDAEDATQEAFIAALRRAETFRREAAFSTWLFRIAVNAATDQARRRGRARTVPLEAEEPGGPSAAGGDPSGAVTTALTVQAALRRVPEDFRVALILCDLYGFGHAQAAGVLEIPVGTVKSRVFRGRLALGEELARIEGTEPPGRPRLEVATGTGTRVVAATSEPAEHRDNNEE